MNWLDVTLGRRESPVAPDLNSDRVKDFLSRALLTPGSLSAQEVQELAAAVVSHLVKTRPPCQGGDL